MQKSNIQRKQQARFTEGVNGLISNESLQGGPPTALAVVRLPQEIVSVKSFLR